MTASFTFVKTRIFRRPWNISSFTSDHLEVVRKSFSSYFHVGTFKLMGWLVCLVIVVYPFFFFSLLFLNEHCIFCVMELSWKKSYSLALAMALSGRAWSSSPRAHRWKRSSRHLYSLFLLLPFSVSGDSHLIPALRVRDPNAGSTLLIATNFYQKNPWA